MLVHGAGVSSRIFSTDLPDLNLLEYLFGHGYDVWLLDFRVSIDLPSAALASTADQAAENDFGAAVEEIRRVSGADSIQVVAHCYGATTFVMAMLAGWVDSVRSVVLSQAGPHLDVPRVAKAKCWTRMPEVLEGIGVDSLTADGDGDGVGWRGRALNSVLRLYPVGPEERCRSATCRRITFMYGPLYEHAQLSEIAHQNLHELFGATSMLVFRHLARMVRHGHVVAADGSNTYLPGIHRMAVPTAFIHGEENRCYLPSGTRKAFDLLSAANGGSLYSLHPIPGYGHIDCIFGRRAAADVFPHVVAHLEATA